MENNVNITIPKTIEEATDALGGIGQLLTAKEWERAAIVYAFTEPVTGNQRQAREREGLSIEAFAALGISGLRSANTVRAYRKAWQDAILDGQATPVGPGERVELPEREFPATMSGTAHSGAENVRAAIRRNPDVITEVVAEDPEVFEEVAEAVSRHPGLTQRATEKVAARVTPKPKEPEPKYWDQVTDEVLGELEAAMKRLHALVENREQLDGFATKKVISAVQASEANLHQYLADLVATYRLSHPQESVHEVLA